MKTSLVLLICVLLTGCATTRPKNDVSDNPRVKAVLDGWDRCLLFTTMNEMKDKKTAAGIVDGAMALCRDEAARYGKELIKAGATPEDAAVSAEFEHKTMRAKYMAMYGG